MLSSAIQSPLLSCCPGYTAWLYRTMMFQAGRASKWGRGCGSSTSFHTPGWGQLTPSPSINSSGPTENHLKTRLSQHTPAKVLCTPLHPLWPQQPSLKGPGDHPQKKLEIHLLRETRDTTDRWDVMVQIHAAPSKLWWAVPGRTQVNLTSEPQQSIMLVSHNVQSTKGVFVSQLQLTTQIKITRALQLKGEEVHLNLAYPNSSIENPTHTQTNPLVLRLSDLIPVVEQHTITQQTP